MGLYIFMKQTHKCLEYNRISAMRDMWIKQDGSVSISDPEGWGDLLVPEIQNGNIRACLVTTSSRKVFQDKTEKTYQGHFVFEGAVL